MENFKSAIAVCVVSCVVISILKMLIPDKMQKNFNFISGIVIIIMLVYPIRSLFGDINDAFTEVTQIDNTQITQDIDPYAGFVEVFTDRCETKIAEMVTDEYGYQVLYVRVQVDSDDMAAIAVKSVEVILAEELENSEISKLKKYIRNNFGCEEVSISGST